jgi:hypothetical protein
VYGQSNNQVSNDGGSAKPSKENKIILILPISLAGCHPVMHILAHVLSSA